MPNPNTNTNVVNLISHLASKLSPEDLSEAIDVFCGNKEPAAPDPAKLADKSQAMDRLPPHLRRQVADWNVKQHAKAAAALHERFPNAGRLG